MAGRPASASGTIGNAGTIGTIKTVAIASDAVAVGWVEARGSWSSEHRVERRDPPAAVHHRWVSACQAAVCPDSGVSRLNPPYGASSDGNVRAASTSAVARLK